MKKATVPDLFRENFAGLGYILPMYEFEVAAFFNTSHTQLHGYREGAGKRLSLALLVLPAAFSKVLVGKGGSGGGWIGFIMLD